MLYVEWCTAPTEGPAAEEAAPRCRHDPAHCVQPCTRTNWRTLCTQSGVAQGPGPSDGTRGARSGPCHCIHALRASVCVASHVIRCPRRQPGTLRHPAPQRKSLALHICADVRKRGSATGSCCTLQPHVAWATARKTRGMPCDTRRGVCGSGRRGARASAHSGRRPCSSAAWPAPFHAMICGYAATAAATGVRMLWFATSSATERV